MATGAVIVDLLVSGTDDWVDMPTIISSLIDIEGLTIGQPELLRERTLDVVERLLAAGLMEAGVTPRGGSGFVRWDLSVQDTMSRITYLWDHLRNVHGEAAQLPGLGDICYLSNTPVGNEVGELLLTLGYTEAFEAGRIPLNPSLKNT
jgi:hypothetical protein